MGSRVLLTGGTGSFGTAFVEQMLPHFESITVYSRDELKQFEMAARFDERLKFVIGDIRDRTQLARAMRDCDSVVHAAAMKQVPACEAHPTEAIDTNVTGSRNVAEVAQALGCHVVALSTDKAVAPTNVYGATKLISDRLFLHAGFTVVRCGNIFGSRGSVVPLFAKQRETGVVTVTDKRMTRYSIDPTDAVGLVYRALWNGIGGRIYIPKMPSYRLTDVAEAIAPGCQVQEIGIRPGEQLHECLISPLEAEHAWDVGDHYILDPQLTDRSMRALYSNENDRWMTVDDIRAAAGYSPAAAQAAEMLRVSQATSGEMA